MLGAIFALFAIPSFAGFLGPDSPACNRALEAQTSWPSSPSSPRTFRLIRHTLDLSGSGTDVVLSRAPRFRSTFTETARITLPSTFVGFHESGSNEAGEVFQLVETQSGLSIVGLDASTGTKLRVANSWEFPALERDYGSNSRLRYVELLETRNEIERTPDGFFAPLEIANQEMNAALGLPKPVDLGARVLTLVLVFEDGLTVGLRSPDSRPSPRRLGSILGESWNWPDTRTRTFEISAGGKMLVLFSGSRFSAAVFTGDASSFRGTFDVKQPIRSISAQTISVGAADANIPVPTGSIEVVSIKHGFRFGTTQNGSFDLTAEWRRWPWARFFDVP